MFVGEVGQGAEVRFSTLAHRVLWADANESEQTVVSYCRETDRDTAEQDQLDPPRAAPAVQRAADDEPAELDVLVHDVEQVKFEYWDWKDKEWQESWDIDRRPTAESGRLPTRVRITSCSRTRGGDEYKVTTQARLLLQEPLNFVHLEHGTMSTSGPTHRAPTHGRRPARQRGVALIAVVVALGMVAVRRVRVLDRHDDRHHRGGQRRATQMRAHFLARSALNLSELVIRLQQRIDKRQGARRRSSSPTTRISSCSRSAATPRRSQAAIGVRDRPAQGPRRRHRHLRRPVLRHRRRQDQPELRQRQRHQPRRRSRPSSTRCSTSTRSTRCSRTRRRGLAPRPRHLRRPRSSTTSTATTARFGAARHDRGLRLREPEGRTRRRTTTSTPSASCKLVARRRRSVLDPVRLGVHRLRRLQDQRRRGQRSEADRVDHLPGGEGPGRPGAPGPEKLWMLAALVAKARQFGCLLRRPRTTSPTS